MVGAVVVLLTAWVAEGRAQVPGSPVLQNAFANPGLAVAANMTGGNGQSFFGAAGAYGLGSGRLQLAGAAGVQRANGATRGAYGARGSATVWTSAGGSLGVGAFAGFGGAARTRDEASVVTNPAVVNVPAGLSVGYRRPLGAARGFSVYASPMYRWVRSEANTVTTAGSFGFAAGADVALTQSFGATVGAEVSRRAGNATGLTGGPSTLFGAAFTFVTGR